eukprot:TRINITY_DN21875_c0_g2_i1.p1 TRINITY_DN21875_c0_g2~~TRINITY_DN21875_c0_g2_i1.p1  ORF type:complete len:501 (+),score=54.23 TRINITY_DN21875_c0_g2_i1:136-1503(+)
MAALGFDDCAACLVPLSEDTIGNPRKLSCGHSLHEPCWLELLRFGVDPTCAFCRASASDPYSGSAEEQCDYGALEYIRAVRGTVAGSPARHVVGRRCLELLQSVLTMNPRHARGRVFMGLLYQKGIGVRQDHEAAIQHFSQAMQDGNGLAAVHVGRLYKEGTGVLKDEPRARELFGLADRGGCLLGTLELAIMCKGGQGGELDAVLARELFSRAAHLGDPLGLHELAVMLRDGEGGPRDEARARELFSRASDLGYTLATLELGGMYMEGLGGEKDEAMGMELYRKVEFGQAQVKRRPVQDDPRTVAQGWVGAGAGKALYASEIKALADTGEWWQLKEPEPTKQDEAWLAMLGLAVEDRPKECPRWRTRARSRTTTGTKTIRRRGHRRNPRRHQGRRLAASGAPPCPLAALCMVTLCRFLTRRRPRLPVAEPSRISRGTTFAFASNTLPPTAMQSS